MCASIFAIHDVFILHYNSFKSNCTEIFGSKAKSLSLQILHKIAIRSNNIKRNYIIIKRKNEEYQDKTIFPQFIRIC